MAAPSPAFNWVIGIICAIVYAVALLFNAYRLSALRNEARHLGDVTRQQAR